MRRRFQQARAAGSRSKLYGHSAPRRARTRGAHTG
jgi:hypothetical protein